MFVAVIRGIDPRVNMQEKDVHGMVKCSVVWSSVAVVWSSVAKNLFKYIWLA